MSGRDRGENEMGRSKACQPQDERASEQVRFVVGQFGLELQFEISGAEKWRAQRRWTNSPDGASLLLA